jgi:addiction module HigA family antidote
MTKNRFRANKIVQLPGQHVRESVLQPKHMSVTDAAKILGVGRPAFSNFLNGNSAVSPDMAARIERAFGIPAQKLLDMQAAYEAAQTKTKGAPANTKAYVPPFLAIKANEIESWSASNISARTRLSVLLRTLVNSTGVGLTKVDFPGNDDAERPGWDGYIVASQGTPWVPEGKSGWEFGCDQDPKAKADRDFSKRTKATDKAVRDETTLVFVTPRSWRGKQKWEDDRKAEKKWMNVRAFDASNLEQWIEQSIAAQAWFAGETHRASNGAHSLDKCWFDWANASDPLLVGSLFTPAVNAGKGIIGSRLSKPPEDPTIIAADSTEEALAFLAQLFSEAGGELAAHRDRVVVFHEPGVLPKLAVGSSNFIAVATTREVERELAPFCSSISSIVVCPRNVANAEPLIVLEPLNYEAFRTSLQEMGFNRDKTDQLGYESGRSLTVLRRRLSKFPAIRTPEWAADASIATHLMPFLFAGAWSSSNQSDQAILSLLASDTAYGTLEKELQVLASLNDAPVWSVGTYRGVVSKIDLLFTISSTVTRTELETYIEVAFLVLSEDDPSLDLPEEDRWKAGIFGKTREISAALRKGISETLVLLSVHGNRLFQAGLGIDVEESVARLIKKLLTPLTTRTLEAHERDLPTYAEAAPDEFLFILEEDLKRFEPASLGLMRPSDTGVFGRCVRAGLLWSLENLAWSPITLPRAVLVLAKLAQIQIDDNWVNKPIASLKSIFRSWMPQTAAKLDQRIAVMRQLADRYPDIAWQICADQFGEVHRTGDYNNKPRWRNDGHGFGEPISRGEMHTFELNMIDMALNWKKHDRTTLGDLIERLHGLNNAQQAAVWDLVKRWAEGGVNDNDKAWVREKIRVTVLSQRGAARNEKRQADGLVGAANAVYEALEPADLLNKHKWLFRQAWIEESADEVQDMDFRKRGERISKLRTDALSEILSERGVAGILEFAEMGETANIIGLLMPTILSTNDVAEFILTAIPPDMDSWTRKNLVNGALHGIMGDQIRSDVLRRVGKSLSQDHLVKILELAPFHGSTWALVDELGVPAQHAYWAGVSPNWENQSDEDLNGAVERLLIAKRPRAAFSCVHFVLEKLRPALLFRLMTEIVTGKDEPPGHYRLDSYYITEAFKLLDASGEFSAEQLAGLEFPYIDALSRKYGAREARGIPNLEFYLEDHPEFFVEAVAWAYKRSDGRTDPQALRLDDQEHIKNRAERGAALLDTIERIPGRNKLGVIEANRLLVWVKTVRQSCAELGRQETGDISLGKLLSNASVGEDGVWPCEAVRDVLEQVQSRDISRGISTGLYNARGVHWRGEGGDQERELAEKYRKWAGALEFSHPFVAATILKRMANTYDGEAKGHDTEAKIERRLR